MRSNGGEWIVARAISTILLFTYRGASETISEVLLGAGESWLFSHGQWIDVDIVFAGWLRGLRNSIVFSRGLSATPTEDISIYFDHYEPILRPASNCLPRKHNRLLSIFVFRIAHSIDRSPVMSISSHFFSKFEQICMSLSKRRRSGRHPNREFKKMPSQCTCNQTTSNKITITQSGDGCTQSATGNRMECIPQLFSHTVAVYRVVRCRCRRLRWMSKFYCA